MIEHAHRIERRDIMYSLSEGVVVPGKRIGVFMLGMTYQEVCRISTDFRIKSIGTSFAVIGENIVLNISSATQRVFNITVWGGFRGQFEEWLGIGTMWKTVIERGIPYYEDDINAGIFYLKDHPRMYFELSDTDDCEWTEADAIVERIGIDIEDSEELA